jgi:hypothetical protein
MIDPTPGSGGVLADAIERFAPTGADAFSASTADWLPIPESELRALDGNR